MKKYSLKSTPPDWDPNNPYHYHNNEGEKIVITPEEWKANVGKPYFKEIEAAVKAEQAAYTGPEYEVNPDFIRDLNKNYSLYRGRNQNMYNYRYYNSQLPKGYTINENGIIFDKDGNAYVQGSYDGGNRFNYDRNNPVTFTFDKGKPIEKIVNFYPINMDKKIKEPLPVDRVMDVEKEKNDAIRNNTTYYISYDILGHGFQGSEYETYSKPKGSWYVQNKDGRIYVATHNKAIIDNLIKTGEKNRPDYKDGWEVTKKVPKNITIKPNVTRDGKFIHIDFSTGKPVVKQQRSLKRNGGLVYLKPF